MSKFLSILALVIFGLGLFSSCDLDILGNDDDEGVGLISECKVKKAVEDDYMDDAVRLALRYQLASGPAAGDILISSSLIDRFVAGISAVYSSDFSARDSVFKVYKIHTTDFPEFKEVRLQVDTTVAWVQEWVEDNRLTGNSDIDGLMNFYGLDLKSFESFSTNDGQSFHFATISSTEPVNITGLTQRFEGIDGVLSGNISSEVEDGNDIVVTDNGTTLQLDFSVAYDDLDEPEAGECSGDCSYRRGWIFEVDENCDVKFINAYGDKAP